MISDHYKSIYTAINKIATGNSILLFVKGKPGLGKSYHIERALKLFNCPYVEARKLSEAYQPRLLYENRNKVIWFRDCFRMFNNANMCDMLKAATETKKDANGNYLPRTISVHNFSTKLEENNIPHEFEFNGSIIFDYNEFNSKNIEDFRAMKSRGEFIDLILSSDDIDDIMRCIASTDEEKEVTEFIIRNKSMMKGIIIDLRTQQKAFDTYNFCKKTSRDWKESIRDEMKRCHSEVRALLFQFMGEKPIEVTDLKKALVLNGYIGSVRSASRRIQEYIEMGELHKVSDSKRGYFVSLIPKY